MENIFNFILSLPVILVATYFLPILGIILVVIRAFKFDYSRNYGFNASLIFIGIALLIPKALKWLLDLVKIKSSEIPYLNEILESDIYPKLVNFSKIIIITGIAISVLSYFSNKISRELQNKKTEKMKVERAKEEAVDISNGVNIITEGQVKNNQYYAPQKVEEEKRDYVEINCPYCAGLNKLYESEGNCKFCGRNIHRP